MNLRDLLFAKMLGGGSGGSGGGTTDYLKLTNRPTETIGGDTLTWDGNTEGLVCVSDLLYKVSDTVVSIDITTQGTVTVSNGETYADVQKEELLPGISLFGSEYVFFVEEGGVGVDIDGLVFPEPGVYFMKAEDIHATSLTIPGYTGFTKEVLKPEVLPDTVTLYADAEMYLYATEDVSDISKRITRAELMKVMQSKPKVLVYASAEVMNDVAGAYFSIIEYQLLEEYGKVYIYLPEANGAMPLFTAEYTAT